MRHWIAVSLGLLLSLTSLSLADGTAPAPLPKDAQGVVDRVEACIHWGGEVGSGNPKREAQIAEETRKSKCDTLKEDMRKIQKKYATNKSVQKELRATDENWQAAYAESLLKDK